MKTTVRQLKNMIQEAIGNAVVTENEFGLGHYSYDNHSNGQSLVDTIISKLEAGMPLDKKEIQVLKDKLSKSGPSDASRFSSPNG